MFPPTKGLSMLKSIEGLSKLNYAGPSLPWIKDIKGLSPIMLSFKG